MWRVCVSPSQAVMAPYARVNLFRSLLGSGLWWGQLPILSPSTALVPHQSLLFSAHTKARARCHRMGGWDRLNQVCVHNCLYACSCARGRGVRSPPSLHICMFLAPAHPDTAPSQHSSCCTCGLPEPACPPSPAAGSVGSPIIPATHFSPCRCPHRPLGLAAGVRLLELLAKHLHLSTATFINIR